MPHVHCPGCGLTLAVKDAGQKVCPRCLARRRGRIEMVPIAQAKKA